jgi:LAO/AO transport system kinase
MTEKRDTATRMADEVLEGNERSAARLISLIERGSPEGYEAMLALFPRIGNAHVVGITGCAGAGKSSLINALAVRFLKEGRRIGVVAIDPSSSLTQGSLLGDRVRMREAEKSGRIFIRSMAQRNYPGGVCRAAIGAVSVMEGMGKDLIFIESIGAGQSDTELFYMADTVVTVFTPEFGDEIQLMKAGLLEIGHVVVVNKTDKPGAEDVAHALEAYLPDAPDTRWRVPILSIQADKGKGVDEVVRVINAHGATYEGDRKRARGEKYARFAMTLLKEQIWKVFLEHMSDEMTLERCLDEIKCGRLDPYSAVERIREKFEQFCSTRKKENGGGGNA